MRTRRGEEFKGVIRWPWVRAKSEEEGGKGKVTVDGRETESHFGRRDDGFLDFETA